MKRNLLLEDGSLFVGEAIGSERADVLTEVVFNTAMTGYQEIITDPSYKGQAVAFTNPLIGNYGINARDSESLGIHLDGVIVSSCCPRPSNWRSYIGLSDWLRASGIPGIEGVDTRALALLIRTKGTMRGLIIDGEIDVDSQLARLRAYRYPTDQIARVSTPRVYSIPSDGPRIALLDMGCKLSIIKCLTKRGFALTVYPYDTPASTILATHPEGLFISNGPGDPASIPQVSANIAQLIEAGLPTMGVCMGQQLLALSQGARTYKLKFGHRGANQPVRDLATGRIDITSQNHNFAVDEQSLAGTGLEVTHINLNDGSVEGIRLRGKRAFAVQFHPEAAAGPHDESYLFGRFLDMVCGKEGWENA